MIYRKDKGSVSGEWGVCVLGLGGAGGVGGAKVWLLI